MKNREFYQQTFSQIHSSVDIRWEDMESMRPKKRYLKKVMTAAAVICLLAALSTAALARDFLGLRSWLMPARQEVQMPVDPETGEREVREVDMISLAGYDDTPESRAVAEWQEFLSGYDSDGAILDAIGNSPTGLEERYGLYLVYTREMADKLDEIVEKYSLKLHTRIIDVYEHPEAFDSCGDFLGDNRAYSAYMYEDGTFKFDGDIDLPDYGILSYQFMRCVRGSFTDVLLNITDVEQYREWTYSTKSGLPVTLALGPGKALILADLGDSFVSVNVLAGTESEDDGLFSSGPFLKQNLESLADSFDFSALTPVVRP